MLTQTGFLDYQEVIKEFERAEKHKRNAKDPRQFVRPRRSCSAAMLRTITKAAIVIRRKSA